MEEGGFTKVEEESFTKRNRGRDKIGTVFKGITLEDLRKESEKRQKLGGDKEQMKGQYVTNKQKRDQVK